MPGLGSPPKTPGQEGRVEGELAHPHRVRMARELRALTQQQVVTRMPRPISAAALSQIEAGRVRPATSTLADLAAAPEVPVGFFFVHTTRLESVAIDDPAPYFRDLHSTTARERRRSAALAILLSDLVAEIERHVRLPEPHFPDIPLAPSAGREEVEEAADSVRGRWQLGGVDRARSAGAGAQRGACGKTGSRAPLDRRLLGSLRATPVGPAHKRQDSQPRPLTFRRRSRARAPRDASG